ncbi:hypothetical protein V5O48_008752 [Marasmius crinis-equi]|uniref:Uncharacterized protein n=1 Tax=Marasmius crinis-equi TaxID=585013 RepID=A0ABR3FDK6_9AGAR
MVMTIISFEVHTTEEIDEDENAPQHPQPSPWSLGDESSSLGESLSEHKGPVFPDDSLNYILDIRLATTLARLRNPPSALRTTSQNQNSLIPLPNTTTWAVRSEVTRLMRAGSAAETTGGTTRGGGERNSRVPGALDNTQ